MEIDVDFKIDTDDSNDRFPKIIIMENDTGIMQTSSEWGDALH